MAKDPLDKNDTLTYSTCDTLTICVPNINVPATVRDLSSSNSATSQVTKKLIADVNEAADKIKNLGSHDFTVTPTKSFSNTGLKSSFTEPSIAPAITDYADLSAFNQAPFPSHDFKKFDLSTDKDLKESIKKLEDLMVADTDVDEKVKEISNSVLTERSTSGHGTFDWLASAAFNQLEMLRSKELITKDNFANVYSEVLQQTFQTATQFVLERDRAYWTNALVRSQMVQANVQALLAKAQLITLPIEVKLKHAQLHAQIQQMELAGYQVESEKARIKQLEAQTDQILAQTDTVRLQNELHQVEIQDAKIKLELSKEQVVNTKEQTRQLIAQTNQVQAQTEQTIEQTKAINAQAQKTLKEINLVDANILEIEAKIRLMGQQTEKELNQIELVKGQVAEAYARISLLGEQIKAAKAQYCDTIDGQPVKGIIGTQNALHRKQSLSYDRDSLYKVLQLQAQGWQTKKTADIGTKSPAAFTAASVDGMLQEYLATYYNEPQTRYADLGGRPAQIAKGEGSKEVYGRVNIDTLKPVDNYLDYVTDAEMDGAKATKVGNTAI